MLEAQERGPLAFQHSFFRFAAETWCKPEGSLACSGKGTHAGRTQSLRSEAGYASSDARKLEDKDGSVTSGYRVTQSRALAGFAGCRRHRIGTRQACRLSGSRCGRNRWDEKARTGFVGSPKFRCRRMRLIATGVDGMTETPKSSNRLVIARPLQSGGKTTSAIPGEFCSSRESMPESTELLSTRHGQSRGKRAGPVPTSIWG